MATFIVGIRSSCHRLLEDVHISVPETEAPVVESSLPLYRLLLVPPYALYNLLNISANIDRGNLVNVGCIMPGRPNRGHGDAHYEKIRTLRLVTGVKGEWKTSRIGAFCSQGYHTSWPHLRGSSLELHEEILAASEVYEQWPKNLPAK